MHRDEELRFEAFVRQNADQMLRTAYLLTGDRGQAEDLLQITLERVARRWSRLDAEPGGYARIVLVHAARDGWRRRRARPAEVAGDHDGVATSAAGRDHADDVAVRQALVAALQHLSRRQRGVLVLRHLLDLSEAETAATLGISVGTVKSTANAGLRRLRDLLPELSTTKLPRS